MNDWKGKTAVVTGAASGIGRALATAFVKEGMNVVLADNHCENLNKAVEGLRGQGGQVIGVVTDVSSLTSIEHLLAQSKQVFGNVHILCNNAGVGHVLDTVEMSVEDVQWVLNTNVGGVFNGVKTFVPHMRAHQEDSYIVNTASVLGILSVPGLSAYCASKAAVLSLSEVLKYELRGTKIGISVLCPGPVATNIMYGDPMRRSNVDERRLTQLTAELQAGMAPQTVAEQTLRAIKQNRFYIFTHPESSVLFQKYHQKVMKSFED